MRKVHHAPYRTAGILFLALLLLCGCGKKKAEAPAPTDTEKEESALVVPSTAAPTAVPTEAPPPSPSPEPTPVPVTIDILCDGQTVKELSYKSTSVFRLEAVESLGGTGGIWTSDDPSVASVDENGVVTCWKAGSAKITYTLGDNSASCTLTVSEPTGMIYFGDTPKSDISLSGLYGYEIQLTGIVSDPSLEVTWSSDDESVATVSENGYVTGKKMGTTTVWCKCGTASCGCIIRVTENPPSYVYEQSIATPDPADTTPRVVITYAGFKNTDFTIPVGTSIDMNYMFYNIDPNTPVTWSTENEAVATVNQNGVVTGNSVGTTNLFCTCGDVRAVCIVRIAKAAQ